MLPKHDHCLVSLDISLPIYSPWDRHSVLNLNILNYNNKIFAADCPIILSRVSQQLMTRKYNIPTIPGYYVNHLRLSSKSSHRSLIYVVLL